MNDTLNRRNIYRIIEKGLPDYKVKSSDEFSVVKVLGYGRKREFLGIPFGRVTYDVARVLVPPKKRGRFFLNWETVDGREKEDVRKIISGLASRIECTLTESR